MKALVVMTTLPDAESAQSVAKLLVELRLAACVNVLAPCRSIYHWQGKIETAEEFPLLIKTDESRYAAIETAIRENHPYQLPEIIALSVERGSTAYLDWVAAV